MSFVFPLSLFSLTYENGIHFMGCVTAFYPHFYLFVPKMLNKIVFSVHNFRDARRKISFQVKVISFLCLSFSGASEAPNKPLLIQGLTRANGNLTSHREKESSIKNSGFFA